MYVNIIIFNSHAVSSILFRHIRVFIGKICISFGFLAIRARRSPGIFIFTYTA
jgi:hypothetical protein